MWRCKKCDREIKAAFCNHGATDPSKSDWQYGNVYKYGFTTVKNNDKKWLNNASLVCYECSNKMCNVGCIEFYELDKIAYWDGE